MTWGIGISIFVVVSALFGYGLARSAAIADKQAERAIAELQEEEDRQFSEYVRGISPGEFDQLVKDGPWLEEPYIHRPSIPFWLDDDDNEERVQP